MNSKKDKDNGDNCNKELMEIIEKSTVATEIEEARTFSETELKFLCRNFKCKVNLWQWNPVDQIRERLQNDGRFKNRSMRYCRRLIAKGVNLFWKQIKYDEDEILRHRQEEFVLRRRQHIWKLQQISNHSAKRLVKYSDRRSMLEEVSSSNISMERRNSLRSNIVQYAENLVNDNTQSNDKLSEESNSSVSDENFDDMLDESLHSSIESVNNTSQWPANHTELHKSSKKSSLQEKHISSSQNSKRSNLFFLSSQSNTVQSLSSNLCELLNVNTESITINSANLKAFSPSQKDLTVLDLNSEEIANMHYDDFSKKMLITSTQSTCQSQQRANID